MSFRIPKLPAREKLEPSLSFNGEPIKTSDYPDQSINLEFYQNTEIRGNTPGSNELVRMVDNETLIYKLENHILPNCSRVDDITYDGALQMVYVPELIKRIKQLEGQVPKAIGSEIVILTEVE